MLFFRSLTSVSPHGRAWTQQGKSPSLSRICAICCVYFKAIFFLLCYDHRCSWGDMRAVAVGKLLRARHSCTGVTVPHGRRAPSELASWKFRLLKLAQWGSSWNLWIWGTPGDQLWQQNHSKTRWSQLWHSKREQMHRQAGLRTKIGVGVQLCWALECSGNILYFVWSWIFIARLMSTLCSAD